MKQIVIMLALILLGFNGFSKSTPKVQSSHKVENIKNTKIVVSILKTGTSKVTKLVPCTRTGTAQVAGVGCVDISVTADSCEAAAAAVADAKKKMEE